MTTPIITRASKGSELTWAEMDSNFIALREYRSIAQSATTPTDYATVSITRTTSHAGGTPGYVNSAFRVDHTVGAGVANYEWGITSVINNSATGGQNVAIYGQGNKMTGAGPTWAGVMEAHDRSGVANPITGLVGLEVDIFADGLDNNNARIGIDLVGGIGVTTAPTITYGMRIGPVGPLSTNATFKEGIRLNGDMVRGINLSSTFQVGLDFSSAAISANAIRLARGQSIAWENTGAVTLGLDATVNTLKLYVSGAEKVGLDAVGPGLRLNNMQVVGIRSTGWAPFTGLQDKTTTYDPSTITLEQLGRRVSAMQAMLVTHGLIGA